jgi:PKD repeat protein
MIAARGRDSSPFWVNVLTMRRGEAGHAPVLARIGAVGGRVLSDSPETYLVKADLSLDQILLLAASDDVQWIDRTGPPEDDMDIARAFHGANYVETQAGYTGAGVRVEVLDGGCDTAHPDLQSYTIHGSNSASSHGTCTSGIVCGSGSGNAAARGVMPNAHLVIADYGFLTNRYNHTAELQNPALSYKCVLQSNSWGDPLTTAYNAISQDMDLILFDHARISILQSQSNNGNQSSRPQAWAKNIISVGGIRHANTSTKGDDTWTGGASIGPAADGRIKPDIASFYDSTLCTDRVGAPGYTSTNYYSSFGGTSGATPISAGHLGLLYQMWADGVFGNAAPGATVFDDRPNNTTMKALIINTATQWTFSGAAHDLTRTHQGWGHPDLVTAWDQRNNIFVVDETTVLTNLGTAVHPLVVSAGAPALKATMVYRDNPGTTSSTLHRINNLNLKVTSPTGTIYWGNVGLSAGMWSTSGGSANNVDTVENVFIQNPEAGTWLVEVIAAELNQDTHVETPGLDCDYALVVSGVVVGAPGSTADFSATPTGGAAPLMVVFTDLSTGGPSSWTWDFGDGGSSTLQNPTHLYNNPGSYTVSLTVNGPNGADAETKSGFIVVTPPLPSLASINPASAQAFQGGSVTLTGADLAGTSSIQIGPANVISGFTVVNATTITVNLPNAPALGPLPVTVTNANGTSNAVTLTFLETSPAELVASGVTVTGAQFTWDYGAGADDGVLILASTSPVTFDFGTPYQILLNWTIIGEATCDAVGIGSTTIQIPPGLAGITFYSQIGAVDLVSSAFTVSNITSTLILF